jgi:hypothetical protein
MAVETGFKGNKRALPSKPCVHCGARHGVAARLGEELERGEVLLRPLPG